MPEYTKGIDRFCPCCENKKNIKNFIPSYSIKDAYLPLCRNCINKIYQKARDKFDSEAAGICVAASTQNVASIGDVIDMAIEKMQVRTDKASGFIAYYDTLKELGEVYDGVMDSDVTLSDYVKINRKEVKLEEDKNDYKELIRTWGRFTDVDGEPDAQAYDFLEERFDKYTNQLLSCDTAMESQYRNLCIAEWHKRKADENGDIADIAKAQENVVKILKLLKLDDFQVESKDEREKFIDRLCWMIEETEPSEEEDRDKYRDIAGYESHFKEIMRSMRNLICNTRDYPEIPKEEM